MGTGIRVLCVDDEPDLASLVARFLTDQSEDIEAEPVTSGADALDRLSDEKVDCIVSDYQMPEMDGLDLLEAVRSRNPKLPFILFTARGSEHVASEAVKAGVSDYIPKALGTDQYELLANRVRNLVERQRARATTRELFNAANDGIIVHDPDSGEIVDVNDAVCALWAAERTDLVGSSPGAWCRTNGATGERGWMPAEVTESREPVDWECIKADDTRFWAEIRTTPARIDGERRVLSIVRDVTNRKRREQRLGSVLAAAEGLVAETDHEGIGAVTTRTMVETLGFTGAALFVADDQTEMEVQEVGRSGEIEPEDDAVDVAIRAREVLGSPDAAPAPLGRLLYWTVGDAGVLVADHGRDPPSPFTTDLVELLVAITQTTLERTGRERQLAEQHEELESLNHVNAVIRDINETLVKVSTREEIEQLVCKQFAAASPFVCAWIGEHDLAREDVAIRVSVGRGADALRDRVLAVGKATDDRLGQQLAPVIEDHDVVVIEVADPGVVGEDHAEHAQVNGFRSLTVVPITYQGVLYDVLGIYAGDARPLGIEHRSVLAELGETIGYAMHTAERNRALLSDTVTELEYEIHDGSDLLFGLSAHLETEVELERLFYRSDDSARVLLRVANGSLPAVRDEVVSMCGSDAGVRAIAERDGGHVIEATVDRLPVMKHLAKAMATIRSTEAIDGTGRLCIEIPDTVSVRRLTEELDNIYDDVTLIARRQRDRTDSRLEAGTHADRLGLTDRQHEVLLTAYHAGFFSWPRESTGEDIAASLDISQPTFHEHLRTGERKVLKALFEQYRSVETGDGN